MKVLILEDESIAADKLERQLGLLDSSIEVLDKIDSIQGAVRWLTQHQADLIFCDIHLSDGLSFRIFDQIETHTPIIFTTAYDQYAIQAFKVNSIDYLLKPIGKRDLAAALEKYRTLIPQTDQHVNLSKVLAAMKDQHATTYQQRFMIYVGEYIRTVPVEDVAYFYAEGKHVTLVTKDGKQHGVDFTLDKLTRQLDPDQYFRVNRQFIVSLAGIVRMYSWTKARIKLELHPAIAKEVIVSVDRAAAFKKWLNR